MEKGFAERVERAVGSVRERTAAAPEVGVVLGSGLGAFAEGVAGVRIGYSDIAELPLPTVAGHEGTLTVGPRSAVLSGRIHYYEGHGMDDVVLPIFLLGSLGVRRLILTNASGGIREDLHPGDLVLLRDHLNLMGTNPLRGPNPRDAGPRFPDMSRVYSEDLREAARAAAGAGLPEGVYAALPGPSYETPAEIRMLRALGADLVGMSTVPEAICASYLGMEVLGISCVTNMAAGISPRPLSHEEVMEVGRGAQTRLRTLLEGVLESLTR